MRTYRIYSGGEFIESNSKLAVIDKYNGKVLAETFLADEGILERTVLAAQKVKERMREMAAFEKEAVLLAIATALELQKEDLSVLLCKESAKPIRYARIEVDRAIQVFRIAAEECKRLPKDYISLDQTLSGKGREGLVKYFPVGIIAGISPFNFPLNLAVHKIAPAIAAGCPIILKPASSTPLSTLALAEIIDRTALPKGAFSVLPMDRKTGNHLVTDERIALLSFTGSPEAGWEMKKNCGKKRIVLELGGNAGVIVTPSADLSEAVNRSITGAFSYSGQICIHAQRFFVHESIFEGFVNGLLQKTAFLKNGDPLKDETDIGPMIDEENAIRVEGWVKEAISGGAHLLCGGKRIGAYFEPTVLTCTDARMKVNCEEVFGPVITVEKYKGHISNAVERINEGRFGLQCGVFTDSVNELDIVFNTAECGGVIHNNVPTLRYDHMPYGGIKDSGLGREGVRYAIQDMMEPKILVK